MISFEPSEVEALTRAAHCTCVTTVAANKERDGPRKTSCGAYAFGGGGSGAGVSESGAAAIRASTRTVIERASGSLVDASIPIDGPHDASAAQQSLRAGTSQDFGASTAWCD
jgi:hypothetical protein